MVVRRRESKRRADAVTGEDNGDATTAKRCRQQSPEGRRVPDPPCDSPPQQHLHLHDRCTASCGEDRTPLECPSNLSGAVPLDRDDLSGRVCRNLTDTVEQEKLWKTVRTSPEGRSDIVGAALKFNTAPLRRTDPPEPLNLNLTETTEFKKFLKTEWTPPEDPAKMSGSVTTFSTALFDKKDSYGSVSRNFADFKERQAFARSEHDDSEQSRYGSSVIQKELCESDWKLKRFVPYKDARVKCESGTVELLPAFYAARDAREQKPKINEASDSCGLSPVNRPCFFRPESRESYLQAKDLETNYDGLTPSSRERIPWKSVCLHPGTLSKVCFLNSPQPSCSKESCKKEDAACDSLRGIPPWNPDLPTRNGWSTPAVDWSVTVMGRMAHLVFLPVNFPLILLVKRVVLKVSAT